jgi:hypothetical protein
LPHIPLVQDQPASLEASLPRHRGGRTMWLASAWPRS